MKPAFVEKNGRFECRTCGYQLSAMMGDDEVPAHCQACVNSTADDMLVLLDSARRLLEADDVEAALDYVRVAHGLSLTLPKKGGSR
jgi:hypothetical protein